jgi:hypothetical protein
MQFKEIISVYTDKYTKPVNKCCEKKSELATVNAYGTYSYHLGIKR